MLSSPYSSLPVGQFKLFCFSRQVSLARPVAGFAILFHEHNMLCCAGASLAAVHQAVVILVARQHFNVYLQA